jgi:hypothetical protein
MDRFLIDFSILDSDRATELEVLPLVSKEGQTVESLSASVGRETQPLTAVEGRHTPDADARSQLLPADEAGVGEEAPSLATSRAQQPLNADSGLDPQFGSVVGTEAVRGS